MFVVNDRGNICEELYSITIGLRQDETIIEKIKAKEKELENSYYGQPYPYGVFENIIDRKLKEYAKQFEDEIELVVIYINDTEFGVYSRKAGEEIFDNIINALNKNTVLFDLRLYNNTVGIKNNE